jgi:hypothetical protein
MANQDFDINIRVNANTAQVDAIRQSFEKLGAQVQVTNAQAAAGGGGVGSLLGRLAGGLAGGIGVATIADHLRAVTQELEKSTELLARQGELLVQNSRSMIQMSKYAQDDADVLKTAEAGLKNIAELHKATEQLQQKELGWTEKIQDAMDKQQGFTKGFHEAQLDRERAAAAGAEQAGKETAMRAVAAAEAQKERRQAQGYAEDIAELTKKLKEQQDLKQAHFLQNDIQGYTEASQAAKEYQTQLDEVLKAREQSGKQTMKQVEHANPQVRAALMNEQAAAAARARGDDRSADLFQQSAERYKQFATPQQKSDISILEKAMQDQNIILGQIRDAWK